MGRALNLQIVCIRHDSALLQVLLRALRDFNMGKLTADDTAIFTGLLNDLFPKTAEHVPRALDDAFEAKVAFSHLFLHRCSPLCMFTAV